jgi:Tol biopolymer transport system component/tRNA A-37 threonylcarbamoyl transferase component Bud32
MTLQAGTRLGPYEILALLGQGGMGHVYRARDTRLDREVAVKILPPHLAHDPEFQSRFEREGRAVAALSHPNILAIHDVGVEAGAAYAVTELLEGDTLRARMDGHGVPTRKGVEIALQIARGLAAAHDKGIVHRDLKPENVFITTDGHVKILDFGLARPVARATGTDARTELRATDPGTVMGTAAYMSPEQVRGEPVDHRGDIFSFGCLLYEMMTGRRAFDRATPAETMTAILRDDLREDGPGDAALPPSLGAIVRHCLEKRPEERFQSARDLAFALQSASGWGSGPAVPIARPARRPRPGLLWIAATIVVAVATGLGVWTAVRGRNLPETATIRATVLLPGVAVASLVGTDDPAIAVSPNSRLLAYVTPNHSSIALHDLQTGGSRTLVEGGEVGSPFFSPDGQFVGFVQGSGGTIRTAVGGAIRKIAVTGGAATLVADNIIGIKGAAWGDDDFIYYSPSPSSGLWRAPAAGGAPEKLTEPDTAHGEKTHRLPFVLPGSRAVLFVVGTSRITSFDEAHIEALRLSDRVRHRLVDGGTAPQYLKTGDLLYERAGQLIAIPFDPDQLSVRGVPVTVADGIQDLPQSGSSYHAVSADGALFFIPRGLTPSAEIVALDRDGGATKLTDAPVAISGGSVSPDGRLLALDPDGATQQIAIVDLTRNAIQRFTFEWDNASPVWTADGSRLVFRSNAGGGVRRLFWQAADGSGVPEPLTNADVDEIPSSIHGRLLAYEDLDPATKNDLWVMSLDDRKPHELLRTPFDETFARFSPDGRWIAYQSNQSGAWEVYVQRYPGSGARLQVSEGGGTRAMWQPDGTSLIYLRGTDVMRATISESGTGTPAKMFALQPNDMLLDVMRDGRLVVARRHAPPPPTSVNLIVNWFKEVRQRTGR